MQPQEMLLISNIVEEAFYAQHRPKILKIVPISTNQSNLNAYNYIQFEEDNFLNAKAMIVGPKDSLYEGGFLFFNIHFPKNYPFSPPDITYVSRNRIRIHPNLYVGNGTNGF